mgnify:FL=1
MAQIVLLDVPIDCGKRGRGCVMGPDAFRVADLAGALAALGHDIDDRGTLAPLPADPVPGPAHLHALAETADWTRALIPAARDAVAAGFALFMGGDHALSLGSVAGVAAEAAVRGVPQFVLWLDAHADIHTPQTTESGHLHGTPIAYLTGRAGFGAFPAPPAPLPEENVCLFGLRSVDPAEREVLADSAIAAVDMRRIDEQGIARPLTAFLERVRAAGGRLHVSLDVDFLDPAAAPGVLTTVPGGASVREAHLVMEILHDSGLVASLDLVELNPALDERGRTAGLMVDLAASLMGRRVFDRPTPRAGGRPG